MKKYFLFSISVLFLQTALAQKLYFPRTNYTDSIRLAQTIPQLAQQLIQKYKEPDRSLYYLNLAYFQTAAELYTQVPSSMTAYGVAKYGDSISTKDLGFAYRIYSLTMAAKPTAREFPVIYENLFMAYYNELSPKLKNYIESYFTATLPELKIKLADIVKTLSQSDSLSVKDGVSLVRAYSNYQVYSSTRVLAKQLLKQIEKDTYVINDSVLVKMPDGGTVALTVVRSRNNQQPLPVVLKYNIYAGNEIPDGEDAVQRGYVGVTADTRGKRLSPDAVEPFEHDAKDAYYIIDWISKQSWCNGSVGMYGGSYLGFSQWSAAKYLHPALKTIVPLVSVGAGIDYPMENNVFMSFCLRWIHYVTNTKLTDREEFADAKRWGTLTNNWYKNGYSFAAMDSLDGRPNTIFQRWLQHPAYDSFWQNMTPQKQEFVKINIPIFSTTGYFDDDQLGAMYYYRQYHQWNKNPNYYLLIGPYTHGGSQAFPDLTVGGYPIDSVANVPILDVIFQWFDHILKGKAMPAILKDRVNFEMMGQNKWLHVSSLNKMSNDTVKLYLSGKYTLLQAKPVKQGYISQQVDFAVRDSVFKNYDVSTDDIVMDSTLKTQAHHLVFFSSALDKPLAISGAFKASILASTNKKDVDLYIRLYEQTPDGKFMAFNETVQRASYANDRSKRVLLVPGKPSAISISNTYITCRQLQKGSRLVLVLGVNKSPDWQINYGTGKDVSTESIKDAAIPLDIKWYNGSWIKIPVLR